VDGEGPHRRAREALDQVVRLARVLDPVKPELVRAFESQALEDCGRPVARPVVSQEDLVAEGENVANRLLDVEVLVLDQRDPDDPRHAPNCSEAGRALPTLPWPDACVHAVRAPRRKSALLGRRLGESQCGYPQAPMRIAQVNTSDVAGGAERI